MSNENSGNVLPSDYCCHLFDFAKLAKIYKFRFANSWFDSPMATWRTLTGTLYPMLRHRVTQVPTRNRLLLLVLHFQYILVFMKENIELKSHYVFSLIRMLQEQHVLVSSQK